MVRRARPALDPAGSPVRTCVGCRQRVSASELLRVIAVQHGDVSVLEVDPCRRRPGRGAHLHSDPACFALAQRRRAFGRALRVTGVIDAEHLREYVARPAPRDPERLDSPTVG